MNICGILPLPFINLRKRALNSLFFFAIFFFPPLSGQNLFQKKLSSLFLTIESQDTNSSDLQRAIKVLSDLGPEAIPFVRKRFRKTRNIRYFYLLQKLKQKKKNVPSIWTHKKYFLEKYREAQNLLQKGHPEAAQKVAEAILYLEPNIFLKKPLKLFILKCKDIYFSKQILKGKIQSRKKIYSPLEKIKLEFKLEHSLESSVQIIAGRSCILVEIHEKEIHIDGKIKERHFSKIIPLYKRFILMPKQVWKVELELQNPFLHPLKYKRWQIDAKIPRCKVKWKDKVKYPSLIFSPISIHCFSKPYHFLAKRPLENCKWALEFHSPKHLFFSSFFVSKREQKFLISALIKSLNFPKLERVSQRVLENFTGKKFTEKYLWRNWWMIESKK